MCCCALEPQKGLLEPTRWLFQPGYDCLKNPRKINSSSSSLDPSSLQSLKPSGCRAWLSSWRGDLSLVGQILWERVRKPSASKLRFGLPNPWNIQYIELAWDYVATSRSRAASRFLIIAWQVPHDGSWKWNNMQQQGTTGKHLASSDVAFESYLLIIYLYLIWTWHILALTSKCL